MSQIQTRSERSNEFAFYRAIAELSVKASASDLQCSATSSFLAALIGLNLSLNMPSLVALIGHGFQKLKSKLESDVTNS